MSRGFRLEVALQQVHVPSIGLEGHVENVTEDRNGSDEPIDSQIRNHPDQQAPRDAHTVGAYENIDAGQGDQGVTDAGNQTEQGIEAEPHIRAREPEPRIEPRRETIELAQLFYRSALRPRPRVISWQ